VVDLISGLFAFGVSREQAAHRVCAEARARARTSAAIKPGRCLAENQRLRRLCRRGLLRPACRTPHQRLPGVVNGARARSRRLRSRRSAVWCR